uniref:Uncharacterized protein n=1 Tax=Parascaris univalens TaxID=6257 RepID=A0A915A6Z1_PARUN
GIVHTVICLMREALLKSASVVYSKPSVDIIRVYNLEAAQFAIIDRVFLKFHKLGGNLFVLIARSSSRISFA